MVAKIIRFRKGADLLTLTEEDKQTILAARAEISVLEAQIEKFTKQAESDRAVHYQAITDIDAQLNSAIVAIQSKIDVQKSIIDDIAAIQE